MTTRREFLDQTATLLAGAALYRLPIPQQQRLGVCLVGLGSLSTNQLAPALQKTKFCRLAGIVTGTPAKAARWKQQYNIPDRSIYSYDTMHQLASNPDVDIVYVVTPNALHAEHAVKAAKAGKHVLCEKPMEISVAKCDEMIAVSKRVGRQLAIGYRCRFEPHHRELARIAKEKSLGDVRLIEAGFGFPIGDPSQWRLRKALAGGGPMMDVGIYALQSARMITAEEPTAVSALTTTVDHTKFSEVEETMTFQLKFPSGILADCRTTYRANGVNRVSAFTERASFGMEPAYNYSGNRGWRSDGAPLRFDQIDQFAAEMDDFANCILTGTPTSVPGEMGRQDVRIMMAAYESARTGRTIAL